MRDTTAIDTALHEVFGIGSDDLRRATNRKSDMPNAFFNRFLHVIDTSGAVEQLEAWRLADSPTTSGRKAHLPMRAILIGFLLNAYWGLGYSYKELAETFTDRITVEQAARLGYDRESGSIEDWYNRSWRTTQRLLNVIDPWHETRHLGRTLTGAENAQARNRYDKAREQRSHVLSALLVRASLSLLPKRYLDGYRGDVALDSTFLQVRGFINPNDYSKKARRARKGLPLRDMLNVDYQCGWYTREGDHNGADHKHSRPGYEIDTPVMIDTRDGNFPFPLITGLSLHRPGAITESARSTIEQHASFTDKRGLVVVDRAFNNLAPHQFQEPIRRLRFETVYDYRVDQLGPQGIVPDEPVIIVDGVPYVNRMPEPYIMISRWHADGAIDPNTGNPYTTETRDEIFAARAPYRLKPKGRIDADGHQRFTYPDPRGYLAFDPATKRATTDNPTGSVTLRLDPETIKHLQKYAWMSEDWRRAYGQRNQVESSNKGLKDHRTENLGDKNARTGRGYAYTYLVATLAVVSANIRRTITGITKVNSAAVNCAPKRRARRRFDSQGQRLARVQEPRINEDGTQTIPSEPVVA
ncbi:hypothetical protein D3248_00135 [Leucobacter zeae]|nr:hypothetical protein [Leucobacter zeae]